MKAILIFAAAIAMLGAQAAPALAGEGSRAQAHGASSHPSHAQQQGQNGHLTRGPVRTAPGSAHPVFGGPRLEQRPDPNHQNPYRPMFSLDATNPGEQHPYFQTRKDGFGYPAARPSPVYLGNGVYVIPR
ncbi:MAG: hypothetical protein ACRET3_04820 [Burkholderiales bacterium]